MTHDDGSESIGDVLGSLRDRQLATGRSRTIGAIIVALGVGCSPNGIGPDAAPTSCEDAALASIVHGAADPTSLPLTGGQVLAVARLEVGPDCSGVLVAPRWALTAAHCVGPSIRGPVRVGVDPESPDRAIEVAAVHPHPFMDVALLELAVDARDVLGAIEPVPIAPFALPPLVGQLAEASGYGRREDGESGARRFLAAPIVDVFGEEVVIDFGASSGTCSGDSGGPLFVLGVGGVRVAGVLSTGDPSCTGRSRFVRLDVVRPWIEERVGATPPDEPACGPPDARGACRGATAVRCVEGALRFETCAEAQRCATDAEGAACVPRCP